MLAIGSIRQSLPVHTLKTHSIVNAPQGAKTMLHRFLIPVVAIAICLAVPPQAFGQDSSSPGGMSSVVSKLNPLNWKMPKAKLRLPNFLVPNKDQDRIVKRKDGLVSDVKKTASSSWQRTKEVFNPARWNPMQLFTAPEPRPSQPKSPGFFQGLFSPKASEPDEQIANVNDFLSQERPQ